MARKPLQCGLLGYAESASKTFRTVSEGMFPETELPVSGILGNSKRRSAWAPLKGLLAGQAHLFIVRAIH